MSDEGYVELSEAVVECAGRLLAKRAGRPGIWWIDRDIAEDLVIALVEGDFIELTERAIK